MTMEILNRPLDLLRIGFSELLIIAAVALTLWIQHGNGAYERSAAFGRGEQRADLRDGR